MSHSNSTSTQHTHPLEKTPEPHLKLCVLVVSLDSLQHFCLLLSLTLAARHSFLQQTTSLPSAPYSQHVPLEFLFKALGLRCFWVFFPSLPLQFFLVVKIIFCSVFFCRRRLVWQQLRVPQHMAEPPILEPEESKPWAAVNAQLRCIPAISFACC